MAAVTPADIKRAAEEVRDELTVERKGPMIDPFALDVLANRPALQARLASKLSPALDKDSPI